MPMPKPRKKAKRTEHISFEDFAKQVSKERKAATRKMVRQRMGKEEPTEPTPAPKPEPKPKAKPKLVPRQRPSGRTGELQTLAERMRKDQDHALVTQDSITKGRRKELYGEVIEEFRGWLQDFNTKKPKGKAYVAAAHKGMEIYGRSDRFHSWRFHALQDLRKKKHVEEIRQLCLEEIEIAKKEAKAAQKIQDKVEATAKGLYFSFLIDAIKRGRFPSGFHLFSSFIDAHFKTQQPPGF